jgi:hypothetical protein
LDHILSVIDDARVTIEVKGMGPHALFEKGVPYHMGQRRLANAVTPIEDKQPGVMELARRGKSITERI